MTKHTRSCRVALEPFSSQVHNINFKTNLKVYKWGRITHQVLKLEVCLNKECVIGNQSMPLLESLLPNLSSDCFIHILIQISLETTSCCPPLSKQAQNYPNRQHPPQVRHCCHNDNTFQHSRCDGNQQSIEPKANALLISLSNTRASEVKNMILSTHHKDDMNWPKSDGQYSVLSSAPTKKNSRFEVLNLEMMAFCTQSYNQPSLRAYTVVQSTMGSNSW